MRERRVRYLLEFMISIASDVLVDIRKSGRKLT